MNQRQIIQKKSKLEQLDKTHIKMEAQEAILRGRIRKLQVTQEKLRRKRVINIRLRASIEEQLVLADGECHIHQHEKDSEL